MKRLFVYFMLYFLTCVAYAGEYMVLPIMSVYDGDTIKTQISESRLPYPLNQMEIRINGIDTPEMPAASYRETGKLGRAKCVKEAELALTARDALIRFIGTASVVRVYDYSWDKYGGRILGKVVVNQMDLATYMVIKGYAVAYAGGTKDTNWCE